MRGGFPCARFRGPKSFRGSFPPILVVRNGDLACRPLRKNSSGVVRVSKIQRVVFVVGMLALIAMSATGMGIVLYRAFPDSPWVTLVGPLGATAAVIALRGAFSR